MKHRHYCPFCNKEVTCNATECRNVHVFTCGAHTVAEMELSKFLDTPRNLGWFGDDGTHFWRQGDQEQD
jgi:hypothetical protein